MPLQLAKNNKNIQYTDTKKITIVKSKRNNKTYRTYIFNMNQEYIRMLLNEDITKSTEKKKIQLYLTKKHIQHYDIKQTSNKIDRTIELNINLNNNKKTTPVSLPKNDIEYLKAYDIYLETLDKINANKDDDYYFNAESLKATIILRFVIDDETNTFKTELSISFVKINLDKDFIKYIKKGYGNIIPNWLNTLITDWNKEYINTIMHLNN